MGNHAVDGNERGDGSYNKSNAGNDSKGEVMAAAWREEDDPHHGAT